MARKSDIPKEERGQWRAQSGDDASDGRSIQLPVATIQKAIDNALAFTPPPGIPDIASVSEAQGGTAVESIVLADFVQMNLPTTSLQSAEAVSVTAASFLSLDIQAVNNLAPAGTSVLIDGISRFGLTTRSIAAFGDNGIGIDIQGTVSGIFCTVSAFTLGGAGLTGVSVTGQSDIPIDININTATFEQDDTILLHFNPSDADTELILNISSASEGAAAQAGGGLTGTIGILAEGGGTVVAENFGFLMSETAIHVKTGARVIYSGAYLSGDITVDVGGTLEIDVTEFAGVVTNNGTMNGRLGSALFGTWAGDGAAGLGYTLVWAANFFATGQLARSNGITAQGDGLNVGTENMVPADGTLDRLTYNTEYADATTVFKIWKNGAVVHTFNATGPSDFEADIGLSVVAGDLIAVEYDAGAAPSNSVYIAYIE